MGRPARDPMEVMKKDIEKRFSEALEEMAEELTFQIEASYESVIQSFYEDYTPRVYERTYSTYEASDRYDDPFGFTPTSDGYESGIHVGPENIPGQPYHATKEWVFPRTFEEGIHGYFKWEMEKQFGPHYWKKMNRKYVMSSKRKEKLRALIKKMIKHAPRKYRSGKTPTMSFSTGDINSTVLKDVKAFESNGFSSKPKRWMDASFRKITQKKNMDMMMQTLLNKYFVDKK